MIYPNLCKKTPSFVLLAKAPQIFENFSGKLEVIGSQAYSDIIFNHARALSPKLTPLAD
jgi:hypothetical protein